jgi:ATP-binding cassette, subfamily A (ABC1), member 3
MQTTPWPCWLPSTAWYVCAVLHFLSETDFQNKVRSTLISVNLFYLDCNGEEVETSPGDLAHMGSPILYLILYGCFLFAILVAVDGGFAWPGFLTFRRGVRSNQNYAVPPDVAKETQAVEGSQDPLRVLHVSKRFGANQAVEDVSFGVGRGTICALLGELKDCISR